jgi:hypothetical protein
MQGSSNMNEPDGTKIVLEDRKRRLRDQHRELKLLKIHKRRLKERLKEGRDWPLTVNAYGSLERADLEKDEVLAPLPDELKQQLPEADEKMKLLRAEADRHVAFSTATDESVRQARARDYRNRIEATAAVRSTSWTEEVVEARLEEAFKTLFRASVGNVRPREFGNAMPSIIREVSDMVHQAGNKSLRNSIAHRFKGAPSSEEMERADDALTWAARFLLKEHPDLASFAQLGAMWKASGAKISKKCEAIGVRRQVFYRDRKEAIRLIVEGLKREGKAPT